MKESRTTEITIVTRKENSEEIIPIMQVTFRGDNPLKVDTIDKYKLKEIGVTPEVINELNEKDVPMVVVPYEYKFEDLPEIYKEQIDQRVLWEMIDKKNENPYFTTLIIKRHFVE